MLTLPPERWKCKVQSRNKRLRETDRSGGFGQIGYTIGFIFGPLSDDFRHDYETCRKLRNRNEARIVEDISPLIAPSPETLARYGVTELSHLIFNTNERWGESIPITDTRPHPDRCVGFSESAFTDNQLQILKPYIGSLVPVNYLPFFLATWRMYFPFFACEAKCGIGNIDVADKQNAHSMSMAVRGIVKLFELAGCQEELRRKIIAFSISHDGIHLRLYGHYALIKDGTAKFYRHTIKNFDFTSEEGKDKWTAYQFCCKSWLVSSLVSRFIPVAVSWLIPVVSLERRWGPDRWRPTCPVL